MTRESLKAYYMQIVPENGEDTLASRWRPDILSEQVDLIFDYFESRTCENCIHISTKCDIFKNNYKYILETRGLEISKNKFTCGLWESIE